MQGTGKDYGEQIMEGLSRSKPAVIEVLSGVDYLSIVWQAGGRRGTKILPAGDYYILLVGPRNRTRTHMTYDIRLRNAIRDVVIRCAATTFINPTRRSTGIQNPRLFKRVMDVFAAANLVSRSNGKPTIWVATQTDVMVWFEKFKRGEVHVEDML